MNKIYEQLDEIKVLWKQLKHYDVKSSTLSTIENDDHEETEDEILSGPDALKKLENINQQLEKIIENENKFKEKLIKQIKGIISSVKYFCDILSLNDEKYKNIENIEDSESLIEKKKRLQNLELELNHMVSERKSIIKELKKEINAIYLELGELDNIDEDIKFTDLSLDYIHTLKNDIVKLKVQQMKNISDFIFKTQDYYRLKDKLHYSTFFQENIDSLKFQHIDDALSIDSIPLSIKSFLDNINELKLRQVILYPSNPQKEISFKKIIDDIIESYFDYNEDDDTNKENQQSTIEIINLDDDGDDGNGAIEHQNNNKSEKNCNKDHDPENCDDTKPHSIPKSISTIVVKLLKQFKEKLPKPIKLTTEFIQFLDDIIELMDNKLNQYIQQIEILLKNIRILYEDLKIDKSKQLKLEADKLENIPVYEEELKNLSKMWQDTQKERVDSAYNLLKQFISKCCLSKEEIDEIESHLTNLYLPSSLEFINNEIERLSNHYEKYKVIYQLIGERYTLIEKMIKFEETASDPMRLRGSSFRLIEEEKFRKNSFPTLVRLEDKLKDYLMTDEYSDFCYEGQLYLDILDNEIENRVFNEAMFHINNQVTYRPKRRIVDKKLKSDKSILKSPNNILKSPNITSILKSPNTTSILKSPNTISILKSPNSITSQSPTNGSGEATAVKKTTKFKTIPNNNNNNNNNTLLPSSIPIANNSTMMSNVTNPNKRKRKISLSSSMLMKKRKSTVGLKTNRKSLPSSLEVIRKTENTKPN